MYDKTLDSSPDKKKSYNVHCFSQILDIVELVIQRGNFVNDWPRFEVIV